MDPAEGLIENLVHHVRDITFCEDLHRARTPSDQQRRPYRPRHRRANRRRYKAITAITSSNPRTQ